MRGGLGRTPKRPPKAARSARPAAPGRLRFSGADSLDAGDAVRGAPHGDLGGAGGDGLPGALPGAPSGVPSSAAGDAALPDAGFAWMSVGELTRAIQICLEDGFPAVAVEGEITGWRPAASGHVYFTLRDPEAEATIDAVMWRSTAARLRFQPKDGDAVAARGAVALYPPRGRYQIVVSSMAPSGEGLARARLQAMVDALRAEGLLDPSRKRPLPLLPRVVGVVTSLAGAALRDILKILRRRAPQAQVVVSPCLVQGAEAPESLMAALGRLAAFGLAEVVIVGRGGGSADDLSAFNDIGLARAVAGFPAPVVSAVGHETDTALTDLVADCRAATPSEAAELVAGDRQSLAREVAGLSRRLRQGLSARLAGAGDSLNAIASRGVWRRGPASLLDTPRRQVDELKARMAQAFLARTAFSRQALAAAAARLDALSPLAVLARGYSVTLSADGIPLRSASGVRDGDWLQTRLHDGQVWSRTGKGPR